MKSPKPRRSSATCRAPIASTMPHSHPHLLADMSYFAQDLEGALKLGVLSEDLLFRQAPDLVRGERLLVFRELRLDIRLNAGLPDKTSS